MKLNRAAPAATAADAAAGGRGGRGGGGGGATPGGSDLVVRDMSTGVVRNVGNVNQFEFDNVGRVLAYTVDAADGLGNGVVCSIPQTERRVR